MSEPISHKYNEYEKVIGELDPIPPGYEVAYYRLPHELIGKYHDLNKYFQDKNEALKVLMMIDTIVCPKHHVNRIKKELEGHPRALMKGEVN